MKVGHGDGVKRIRAGGNAMEARRGKKRGKITGEAIQLISAPVGEIPSSLSELSYVVILVEIGVVERKCILCRLNQQGVLRRRIRRCRTASRRRLGQRSASERPPVDAQAACPLRIENITFAVVLYFDARKHGEAVARQLVLLVRGAGSEEVVIGEVIGRRQAEMGGGLPRSSQPGGLLPCPHFALHQFRVTAV